jgi:ribosomal protein S27AE
MNIIQKQTCPLCGIDANFVFQDREHQKQFECSKCGLYTITKLAESKLSDTTQDWRAQCSETARLTPRTEILEIRTEPVSDQRSKLCAVRIKIIK